MFNLLSREDFRNLYFKRDGYKCIICNKSAIFDNLNMPTNLSVHHIIERKLFNDGVYYLENGATLCDVHHLKAETTELSCTEIREKNWNN